MSRRHVAIARNAEAITVRDLGEPQRHGAPRNANRRRDPRVSMTEGLELKLGGEVPLRLSASDELPGALAIEVGGSRYVAPLGPARVGVGAWSLETASDGWLELVTGEGPVAYLGSLRLEARAPLLSGDTIAANRGTRASSVSSELPVKLGKEAGPRPRPRASWAACRP